MNDNKKASIPEDKEVVRLARLVQERGWHALGKVLNNFYASQLSKKERGR